MHEAHHSFSAKLAEGEIYEAQQDAFYGKWFNIEPVTSGEQRRGKDRRFSAKDYPALRFTVEYKGDDKATDTKNLFVEILSVDTDGTPGWALTSTADFISVYVPQEKIFYWLHAATLRAILPYWFTRYPIGKAPNKGYFTHGILVPRNTMQQSPACLHVFCEGAVPTDKQSMLWAMKCFWPALLVVGGPVLAGVVVAVNLIVRWWNG